MKEFQNFVASEDVVTNFHKIIETDVVEFKGDAEKYYPKIYKSISETENPFLSLSHQAGLVLGFDIANYILAEFFGVSFKDDTLQFDIQQIKLDKREKDIVHYVAGYVFTTLHNRINYQNTVSTGIYKEQCLAILLAGKADTENNTTEQKEESRNDSLVKAVDRGGLWSVKQDTFELFLAVELHFKRISVRFKTKIDSKEIVPVLMKNSAIITQYSILKYDAGIINEEISQNLLEDILMLFIRVRSFAYANNKIQLHKAKNNSLKKNHCQLEIKKSTKHLEQGH